MKRIDRILQQWRIRIVFPYVPDEAVLLDVGCYKGELLRALNKKISIGIGIDPDTTAIYESPKFELIKGRFPEDLPLKYQFNCITMLAVFEHIPPHLHEQTVNNCFKLLKPGGVFILTVPHKKVDALLDLLKKLRLITGMKLEEHYGLDTKDLHDLFADSGFHLLKYRKFQAGLNNLFVFRKK